MRNVLFSACSASSSFIMTPCISRTDSGVEQVLYRSMIGLQDKMRECSALVFCQDMPRETLTH